jgi:hypothetical protein
VQLYVIAYTAFWTPFEVCFLIEKTLIADSIVLEILQYFNYIIDIYFACDIIVNFRSAYLSEAGASPPSQPSAVHLAKMARLNPPSRRVPSRERACGPIFVHRFSGSGPRCR